MHTCFVKQRSLWQYTRLLWAGLLVGVALSSGCGTRPPEWKAITLETTQPPPPSIKTDNQLVVYLDKSESMAGYVAADTQKTTVFSQTLLELREVVSQLSPKLAGVYRTVDAKVSSPAFREMELAEVANKRDYFNGQETNLVGAIKAFSLPLTKTGSDSQGNAETDAVPRLHVLVTDGVQSTKQQPSESSCVSGSDAYCVKSSIQELLEKGWAGTILGVRSEFVGKVYPEKGGGAFTYQSKSDTGSYRPFYLYIFSPDRIALDELVVRLKKKLRPVLGSEDAIREYSLSGPYSEGVAQVEVGLAEAKKYVRVTQEKPTDKEPARLTLRVNLDTERNSVGAQNVTLIVTPTWNGHALASGMPKELPGLLKWELQEVELADNAKDKSRQRQPELKIVKQGANEPGQMVVQLSVGWTPGTGSPVWRLFRLVGRLNVEEDYPPWVEQWSTKEDSKPENANRTFNLVGSLSGLWNNPQLKKQAIAEIWVRVGP